MNFYSLIKYINEFHSAIVSKTNKENRIQELRIALIL